MKPPVPLPKEPPFITFYTPTFCRPEGLAACMRSVGRQTAVAHIEHLVFPDYVRHGIPDGLYGRMKWYFEACRGRYVHVLCDDDMLASDDAVAKLMAFAKKNADPPVILVRANKAGLELPFDWPSPGEPWAPVSGQIDLSCYVLRADIWRRHVDDYGLRYEGDYDHAVALQTAGHRMECLDLVFVDGDARNGRPEVDYR